MAGQRGTWIDMGTPPRKSIEAALRGFIVSGLDYRGDLDDTSADVLVKQLGAHGLSIVTVAEARSIERRLIGPCPCECTSGGFCGGCGHAGCGNRRG